MWLSYDADEHRFLPLEELTDSGDWPWSRRVTEAEARPEDSFIWWAEATRDSTPPDESALGERVQASYDRYRQLRFADFKHAVGALDRQGDRWIVTVEPGEVGYVVYGPNVPMPSGRWVAKFRASAYGHDGGTGPVADAAEIGSVDVVAGLDATPIAARGFTLKEVSSAGTLRDLSLPFELAQTEVGVQFRLHTTGQVGLSAELGVSVDDDRSQPHPADASGPALADGGTSTRMVDRMSNVSNETETETQARAPDQSLVPRRRGPARSVARAILWPIRRFVDPRVAGLAQAIEVTKDHLSQQAEQTRAAVTEHSLETQQAVREVRELVEADLDAATEAATVLGQGINEVRALAEASEAALGRIEGGLAIRALADDGEVDELDPTTARLLNYASSHRGFAAQRGLWFNWPVSVTHESGDVTPGEVNERIAETAYAFRALSAHRAGRKDPRRWSFGEHGRALAGVPRVRSDCHRSAPLPTQPPEATSRGGKRRGMGSRREVRRRALHLHARAHRLRRVRAANRQGRGRGRASAAARPHRTGRPSRLDDSMR